MNLSLISNLFGARPRAAGGLNPLDDRLYTKSGGGTMSIAGVPISPDTAVRVAAVYRCVSILANALAMFPKCMYEKDGRDRNEAPDHPLDPIISFKPNRRQCAFEFWRIVCYDLMLRQNAFVQIVPGGTGRAWVGQLIRLHPDRVDGPEELPDGRLRYVYTKADRTKVPMIGGVDIWHLTGLSSDGLRGMAMTDIASDSIGVAMAAERHAGRFYERGVKTAGVLQHKGKLTQQTADEMADSFRRRWAGEQGVGGVPVLWEGMTFQPVSMTLKDAEFLDSRKWGVTEIARWWGVPPHMVGDVERSTSWGSGIEVQGLGFLIYSLQPWISLLESSIRYTLVVQPERYYAKFNVSAILRMDAKTQADVLTLYIEKGVISPNEARELLERNPRDGGDDYVDITKTPEPLTPTTNPPPQPPPGNTDNADQPPADYNARAKQLERALAEELLEEEQQALGKMARQHSRDSEAWRSAVAGFYGRFARRVSGTGVATLDAARAWCSARRDLVLADGGLHTLTTGHPASDDALLGGSPC